MSTAGLHTEIIISADRHDGEYWRDIWRFRELLYFFAWRDVLVRYKQTVIGVAWAIIRPLIAVVVMTLIFGRVAKLDLSNVPYPVLVVAAALPWQFFASALGDASVSLLGSANLITKIYFPRVIVPLSAMLTSVFDFAISIVLALAIFFYCGVGFSWKAVFIPVLLLWAYVAALGPSLLLSALTVRYRDFRYVVPFILQLGAYLSPVGFTTEIVTERLELARWIFSLNPMVGVIDAFRWALIPGYAAPHLPGVAVSLVVCGVMMFVGVRAFRGMERSFADVI